MSMPQRILKIRDFFPSQKTEDGYAAEQSILRGLINLASEGSKTGSGIDFASVTALRGLAHTAGNGGRLLRGPTVEKFQQAMIDKGKMRQGDATAGDILEYIADALDLGNWKTVLVMDRFAQMQRETNRVVMTGAGGSHADQLALGLGTYAAQAMDIYKNEVVRGAVTPELSGLILKAWQDSTSAAPLSGIADEQFLAREKTRKIFQILSDTLAETKPDWQKISRAALQREVNDFLWTLGERYPSPAEKRPAGVMMRGLEVHSTPDTPPSLPLWQRHEPAPSQTGRPTLH